MPDFFEIAKQIVAPVPRDEVEEGIQAVIASLGVQAAELRKLADDLEASDRETAGAA